MYMEEKDFFHFCFARCSLKNLGVIILFVYIYRQTSRLSFCHPYFL